MYSSFFTNCPCPIIIIIKNFVRLYIYIFFKRWEEWGGQSNLQWRQEASHVITFSAKFFGLINIGAAVLCLLGCTTHQNTTLLILEVSMTHYIVFPLPLSSFLFAFQIPILLDHISLPLYFFFFSFFFFGK